MTRPSFLEGAALALAASIGGSILYSGLDYLLGPGLAARLLIAALGLAYLFYVLVRSEARVGRLVSLTACWGVDEAEKHIDAARDATCAELVDVATQANLWGQSYDRLLTPQNLFELQSAMAMSIAAALQAALSYLEKRDS
mgnify:CR=1 FL=1